MRIGIVSETWPPEINGVALTVHGLAAGLAAHGHAVDVVRPRQARPGAAEPYFETLFTHGAALPRYPGLRFGLPAGRTLHERWTQERPDAVYIATPHPQHAEWCVAAARAGKHILCEKPITLNHAEAMVVAEAAREAGVFLMEAFMYRHNPQTRRLQELVAGGAIGELRLIRSTFSYGLFDTDNIRLRTEVEGGALMDVGCYDVSASRLLGGEPERVWGRRGTAPRAPTGSSPRPCASPAT